MSFSDFADWRAQAQSFEGMGAAEAARLTITDRTDFPIVGQFQIDPLPTSPRATRQRK